MAFWSKKKELKQEDPPQQAPKPANTKGQTQALGRVQNILAVAAGKGGVGKSTVSIQLAEALQGQGYKIGILDADIHGPSVPIMLSCARPSEMREELIVPPTHNGIKIISPAMFSSQGAHIMRGPMAANFVRQLLSQTDWGELDVLIIDYPPGTGDIQLTLSQSCNITAALMVSSPQELALADVRKACQMFETLKVPLLGFVETMSWFVCDSCEKKHFIFKNGGVNRLAQETGVPLLGQIPLHPHITESGDSGQSLLELHPKSPETEAFLELSEAVMKELKLLKHLRKDGLASFSLKWQEASA